MENRIPLPTDNIYKFYALFGLLLAVFGFGSTIYVNKYANDLIFNHTVEYEVLKTKGERSVAEETRYKVLEKMLGLAREDKEAMLRILGVLLAISSLTMMYGFFKWHTSVQPVQDEIARLTLKKLKRELGEDA